LVDAWAPLESDCTLELLSFDSEEAQKVFWHSSAHILGQALEKKYGCALCVGPPLKEGGFFYEARMPSEETRYLCFPLTRFGSQRSRVSKTDFKPLNQVVAKIIKEKQRFERLVVTKEEALEIFKVPLVTKVFPNL
jgi:threonyl-tRNA synthetase